MSLEEGFGFVGFFWFVCCFVFLTHPYSTATLYPIHLISIFPQSASTVVSISHTPEKPQMIHISLWAGVYLQTCPVAQCTIPTHLQQNNSYPQWHFQFGETHDPSTEQVSDIAEVVHKSPFNSTSHLLETLTKKKRLGAESCGNKDLFVEVSASKGRWFWTLFNKKTQQLTTAEVSKQSSDCKIKTMNVL